jgi:hypothetical protein
VRDDEAAVRDALGERMNSIEAGLYQSAKRFSGLTMEAYHEGQWDLFFINAGTTLELLGKSYLASLHPSMIAKRDDFDSFLHACGREDLASTAVRSFRTIPATDVLQYCARLIPTITNLLQPLRMLFWARNGIVHAGSSHTADMEGILIPYLRGLIALLESLGVSKQEFFGELGTFVDSVMSKANDEDQRYVARAIPLARQALHSRFREHEEGDIKIITEALSGLFVERRMDALEERSDAKEFSEDVRECPACGGLARVEGAVGKETKIERRGKFTETVRSFYPRSLYCEVCHLKLNNSNQLRLAGIPPYYLNDECEPVA